MDTDHNNNVNTNHDNNDTVTINNKNPPGQRPIGVLDPLRVRCVVLSRPRKVGAPGLSAAEVGPERSP